jgi:hypothetical protein
MSQTLREQRRVANRRLLAILRGFVEADMDLRFSQILCNCGFVLNEPGQPSGYPVWRDEYHLESDKLLDRVREVTSGDDT